MFFQIIHRFKKKFHAILVNSGYRLIQKQQIRLIHHRQCKKHSLQLSSGQITNLFVDQFFCLKNAQMLFDLFI